MPPPQDLDDEEMPPVQEMPPRQDLDDEEMPPPQDLDDEEMPPVQEMPPRQDLDDEEMPPVQDISDGESGSHLSITVRNVEEEMPEFEVNLDISDGGSGSHGGSGGSGSHGSGSHASTQNDSDSEEENIECEMVTWTEFAKFGPIFFSALFALISLKYPGETMNARMIRGYVLTFLTVLYGMAYALKLALDYKSVNVRLFQYVPRYRNRAVFYPESISHLLGMLMLVWTIYVSIYTMTSPGADDWICYTLAMLSIGFTMVCGASQILMSDTRTAILVPVQGGRRRRAAVATPCPDIPRIGRYIVHDVSDTHTIQID
ncbi:uncharacterized protein LOC108212215 [Daucus carota subsp. sativus]|uniref:uncharacterized protein LOC108212215 n=1 Tax=Daucus carota subsp. sativus TaxID=79200 RepID=UPI0030837D7B